MGTEIRVGEEFGGYRIESLLGRGGMGAVYLARHLRLDRMVALKVLDPELARDEGFRERFLRESRLAAALNHPNIVPVHDADQSGEVLFLSMRYVEGSDLGTLLRRDGPTEPERSVHIVAQVASALDAAHARGLVHRDVKPANILVASGQGGEAADHAYLSDFGLAKPPGSAPGLTKTGQFLGSIDYAAPEQFEGKSLTPRTDVYSLGCVLYECLTGEAPFVREQEAAVMYAHLHDPPPRPSARPGIPPAMDGVVARAMAKRPEDRYADAGGLAEAARSALPTVISRPEARRPRRRLLVTATSAVAAAAIVVAALVLTLGHRTPAPTGPGGHPTGGRSSHAPVAPPDNSLVELDPATGRIEATVGGLVPGNSVYPARRVEVGEGGVWVDTAITVQHVDPQSHSVVAQIHPQTATGAIAVGQGAIWAVGNLGLVRISPATDEVEATIPFDTGIGRPVAVVVHDGDVWFLVTDGRLVRVDAGSNEITMQRRTTGAGDDLTVGEGALWAVDRFREEVTELNWSDGHLIREIHVAGNLDRVVAGFGTVWVLDEGAGTVIPIDPASGEPAEPIRVGGEPIDMAIGLGAVWVLNRDGGTITRIDTTTRDTTTILVGGPVASMAVDPSRRALWVYLTQ
jgi:streptogramin lyase